MELYQYIPGSLPVIVSIPHAGTFVPETLLKRFLPQAQKLPDTDWHVASLYAFAKKLGVHMLIATHSRYVIDLNRNSNDQSLYPGKFVTGLCPTTSFDGAPIYRQGMACSSDEIQERIHLYWQPYHDKLQSIIKKLNRPTILIDAHSIRSQIATLFEGILPDLNIGTADGVSAHEKLVQHVLNCCEKSRYSVVLNGRFKGGYITRHYGNPEKNIHAIQLEIAQHNYMQENYPFTYDSIKARKLQITLKKLISECIDFSF